MDFQVYKPNNQTPSFSKKYIERAQQNLPTIPRINKASKSIFFAAWDIFLNFYPDFNPKDDPEEFDKLSLLLWDFWVKVEDIANETDGVVVKEYNDIRAQNMDTAKEFIKKIIKKVKLEEDKKNPFMAKLCFNIKKKKEIKLKM